MKKITILISLFLFFSLVNCIPITSIVKASPVSHTIDFEDGVALSQYNNGILATTDTGIAATSDFYVSGTQKYSGALSFCALAQGTPVRGWWNYTSTSFMTNWSCMFYEIGGVGDLTMLFRFLNSTDVELARMTIDTVANPSIHYVDNVGVSHHITNIASSTWLKFSINCSLATGLIEFWVSTSSGTGFVNPRNPLTSDGICKVSINSTTGNPTKGVYLDDNVIVYDTSTGGTPGGTGTTGHWFRLHFIDQYTGKELYKRGTFFLPHDDYVINDCYSSLWSGSYKVGLVSTYFLGLNFTNGGTYDIIIENSYGKIGGTSSMLYWNNYTITLNLYNGVDYYVYLTRALTLDEYYSNKGYDVHTKTYVETDKTVYSYGETVSIRYKTPTIQKLNAMGKYTGGWILGLLRDKPWNTINPGSSNFYPSSVHPITYYGDWQYEPFTPPKPTDNIDTWGIYIEHDQYIGIFNPFAFPDYLYCPEWGGIGFTVLNTGIPFIPFGNITSVNPSIVSMGEEVSIYYNANNNCSIDIREVSEPIEKLRDHQVLAKPPGTVVTHYTPDTLGYYIAELRVFNGVTDILVDSMTFNVTDTGNTSGSYGYNSEFLYIPDGWFIAGYSRVSISYRSLKNNTLLSVVDSFGQRTPYSTNVTTNAGTLSIKLPINAKIGIWQVTLYGQETLYANFSVIAEEGNFIEFTKNVFYDTELLQVMVQHTHKVLLVFYKDSIAQGRNILLKVGQNPNGMVIIPSEYVQNAIGNWRVELWLTNNLTRIRLLSSGTCNVISEPYEKPDTSLFGYSIDALPVIVKVILAFVIIIVMILLPMLVAVMLSKGNISIDIPALVYVAFFFTGIIIDILLGLLEIYVLAIVLFGLILTLVITWLIQNKGSKT